eukprot:5050252-Karenia_brevis.AAC.1
MGRSVYQLLANGIKWETLTPSQRRRFKRDLFFCSPKPAGVTRIQVADVDADGIRIVARAKARQRQRDSSTGLPSHSLRTASGRAFRCGAISSDEYRSDQ